MAHADDGRCEGDRPHDDMSLAGLRESEKRYRGIVEALTDYVFTVTFEHGQAVETRHGRGSEVLTGYTAEEFASDQYLWIRMVPQEEHGLVLEQIAKVASGLLPEPIEHRLCRKDGAVRWVQTSLVPHYDENHNLAFYDGLIRDVTARKLAEEKLLLTRHCLDESSITTWWVGPDGCIQLVNEEACRRLGYAKAEFLGMEVWRLCADLGDGKWDAYWEQLRGRGAVSFESLYRRKDTSTFPVELTATLVVFQGREIAFMYANDITERRRADDERQMLESRIKQSQKLESLGIMAGGIAHDFNNMLMAILGNADLALDDLPADSPVRPMIEEIDVTVRRAADLCRQMLAYSGRAKLVMRSLNLSEAIRKTSPVLDISLSKKAQLRYTLAAGLPAVDADAAQIHQVLVNLVTNAAEALGEEGGTIEITTGLAECDRVYLRECLLHDELAEGAYVFVDVSDTGHGMDRDTVARIFDPFYTTKFTGRGLGLAAVLGIVRGHKGAIRVWSTPGAGSTFRILLPALRPQGAAIPNEAKDGAAWRGHGAVLLVDDEDNVRTLGRRMLERLGFQVVAASSGKEGVEAWKQHKDEVRCVLLDLTMADMDGEETLAALRGLGVNVPIVLTSGYSEQDLEGRLAGANLAAFIQKPYRLADLTKTLRDVLPD